LAKYFKYICDKPQCCCFCYGDPCCDLHSQRWSANAYQIGLNVPALPVNLGTSYSGQSINWLILNFR